MSGGKPWGGPYSPKPTAPRPETRGDRLPPTENLPVYGEEPQDDRAASPFERPAPARPAAASRPNSPKSDDWRSRLSSAAVTYDDAERARRRAARRATMLPWFASPFLLAAFVAIAGGNPVMMAANLGIWGLIAFGAHLIGEGIKAQTAYEARSFAAAPALPRKLLGSLAAGLGVGLGAWLTAGFGLVSGLIVGGLAAAGLAFSFGLDPTRAKGDGAALGLSHEDLDAALTEARGRVAALDAVARNLKDRSLGEAIREVMGQTNQILARIEQDPNDLRRSRKFLKVYLDGVLEAAKKYERAQSNVDPETEWKFRRLLRDMKQTAVEHYEKLLDDDKTDLDVEIEVLADRLKHEAGV